MDLFKDVSFRFGGLLLEGLAALAVRAGIALLILLAFRVLSKACRTKLFPRLLAHSWTWRCIPILLRGFAKPFSQFVWFLGIYFALASLPWAAALVRSLLLTCLRITVTCCLCWGLWESADVCELLLHNSKSDLSSNQTVALLVRKGYKAIIGLFGALMLIEETGLPVTGIITGAGLVGLTVSLAAQNSASNIFNGLLILVEHPFGVGDWVTVDEVSGAVEDITFTATKIRALDNSLYVVPNSTMCSAVVNNATNRTKRLYRFTLSVMYSTSRSQLEQLMADVAALLRGNEHIEPGSVTVRLTGFSQSSIDILVSAYVRTADLSFFLEVQNELNLTLLDIMRRNGVQFAFPSTSVYMETPRS